MAPVFSMMFCGPISAERIVLTGIVALVSGSQLVYFARRVYFARKSCDVKAPSVTGPPEFERTYRAQQSVLEWQPVFMTALWTSSIFFHQVPSAIFGVLHIIGRQRHFNSCCQDDQEREHGACSGGRALGVMSIMAAVGLGRTLVRMFMHHGHSMGWQGPGRVFVGQ